MYKFLCACEFSKIKKRTLSKFLNKWYVRTPGHQRKEGRSNDLPRKLPGNE